MHETIITELGATTRQRHAQLSRLIEAIDQGPQARLEVRRGERGKTWVVHLGRTPLAAYGSISAVAQEVRAAIASVR